MRMRGTSFLVGLAAAGMLLTACTGTQSAAPDGSAAPAVESTTDAAAAAEYLWMLSASGGTITGIGDDTGTEALTLTLTGVGDHATQFADRPARDAFVISIPDFADRWGDWFGSTPPNAVLSYRIAGDDRPHGIVLEIDDPAYDPGAGTLTFTARHLHRGSDPHPNAIAPIAVTPRSVPASFASASLFIDSADDPAVDPAPSGTPDPSAAASTTAPPSAAPTSAAPEASASPDATPELGAAAEASGTASIVGRVTPLDVNLGDGRFTFDPGAQSTAGASSLTSGISANFTTKLTGAPATSSFAYQVYELGEATGYWVRGEATGYPADSFSRNTSSCDFFEGDPAAGGTQISTETEPYECTMTYQSTEDRGEYVVRYEVAPKVWATVRGSITPQGGLSLTGGQVAAQNNRWDFNGQPVTGPLASAIVPSTKTDSWVAYHRNGDPNVHAARVDFAYQIVDDGTVTPYWVGGHTENYRGVEFDHDGSCAIYDDNPIGSEATEVDPSPYVCAATGSNVDGRGDWRVDFTVSPQPTQKIDAVVSPVLARSVLQKGCSTAGSTCSFIPQSIEDANLPGVQVSRKTANTGPEPVEAEVEWSYRHAVRNSVGIEVDLETKEDFLIESVTASVKVKYNIAVTNTYTTTTTNTLTIPPGCSSWWELSPAYQQVTGDFVVSADGTLYRVNRVTWTLPEAPDSANSDGMSPGTLTARSEPVKGSTKSCSME